MALRIIVRAPRAAARKKLPFATMLLTAIVSTAGPCRIRVTKNMIYPCYQPQGSILFHQGGSESRGVTNTKKSMVLYNGH